MFCRAVTWRGTIESQRVVKSGYVLGESGVNIRQIGVEDKNSSKRWVNNEGVGQKGVL